MKKLLIILLTLSISFTLFAAGSKESSSSSKPVIVATTTMLGDLSRVLFEDDAEVQVLMGPGVDPHLYVASANDVNTLSGASVVLYSGLHLEGKMGEIFANLKNPIIKAADGLNKSELLSEGDGHYDPHFWFSVKLWKDASSYAAKEFAKIFPNLKDSIMMREKAYQKDLDNLDKEMRVKINLVNPVSRKLVTAHDAFNYFGRDYNFEVVGLQGISTAAEAGTKDVSELADYIKKNQIKAIFVESSVPVKNVKALQEAVKSRGFNVEIGGELYSDSLGDKENNTETYIKTVMSNVDTVVNALK